MTMHRIDEAEGDLVLGRYRLKATDGRSAAPARLSGPIAEVVRARDSQSGREVAIKRYLPQYGGDPRFAIRFREQLKRVATLQHAALVTLLDYGWDGQAFYIINEWVDGLNLSTYLAEYGALTPPTAVHVARQICAALGAVHRAGLEHRGLKPENVFLTTDGGVKVADPGLSLLASDSGLSRTTVMLGAVNTMSPEQARGKPTDARSDIYSLGVLLFAMVTGHFPFEAGDAWSVVRMHVQEPPPSLLAYERDAPSALAAIVEKALQKSPDERFATVEEMDAALAPLPQTDALLWLLSPEHAGNGKKIRLHARFGDATDLALRALRALRKKGSERAHLAESASRQLRTTGFLVAERLEAFVERVVQRLGSAFPGKKRPSFKLLLLGQFVITFAIAFLLLYALSGLFDGEDARASAPASGDAVNASIHKVAPAGVATPTLASVPTHIFAVEPEEPTPEATTAVPEPTAAGPTGGSAAVGGQNGGSPPSGGGSASGGGKAPNGNGPPPHAGPPGGPPGQSGDKPGRGRGRP